MEICHRENYIGKFGDKRLDRRAGILSHQLYAGGSSSIHRICLAEDLQRAAYRFLHNEKVSEAILIASAIEKTSYMSADRDLLVIQDTTEINLRNHHNRLQPHTGLGPTGNDVDPGFFVHASLVLDSHSLHMLGFADIRLWHRSTDHAGKLQRNYKYQSIEQKESGKWLKAARHSQSHLCNARSVTFIQDREGDIFEQFASIPDRRTHLIIRSRDNRNLADGGKLFERLSEQPLAGSYTIDIAQEKAEGTPVREACIGVKFCKVSICRPKRLSKFSLPCRVDLYAVEARELSGPSSGSVLWRILTTQCVNSYCSAIQVINRYRQRWHIEQLFRVMKHQGYDIESSELESGWAIRKLSIMIMSSAMRVMQLRLAYNNAESQGVQEVFDQEEIECLQTANESLQGQGARMRNTNAVSKLSWATWVIARLGGWKPYDNRPPGPIILKRGLDRFEVMMMGWRMARRKDMS
jgi:hypothetical protein